MSTNYTDLWNRHKHVHGLQFDASKDSRHFENFVENHNLVMSHNAAKDHAFKLGHNHLSHWIKSLEQFKSWLTLKKKNYSKSSSNYIIYRRKDIKLPVFCDQRELHCVTRVKNQLQCGSCWAFSTVGCIEGTRAKVTGRLEEYSEQQLVDCSTENSGCNGGLVELAMDYVIDCKGLNTESNYPYIGKKSESPQCKTNSSTLNSADKNDTCIVDGPGKIKSYICLEKGDEVGLAELLFTNGPVSVAINAGKKEFMMYKYGIYSDLSADREDLDHAVLLVGFGTENGQDYWIVKNSWSEKWGESGYFRVARGTNQLGIANDCVQSII